MNEREVGERDASTDFMSRWCEGHNATPILLSCNLAGQQCARMQQRYQYESAVMVVVP